MNTSTVNLDTILRRVQALLNQADHPNTDPVEAETFRAKAEEMMRKYRIEEEHLRESGAAPSLAPVFRVVSVSPMLSPYSQQYLALASYAFAHVGARAVYRSRRLDDGSFEYVIEVVGFESDVRYGEMLFTSARLAFGSHLEPTVDRGLSDKENVYRLRKAGMERSRVSVLMGWGDKGSSNVRVTKLYAEACAEHGEDPALVGRGTSAKVYREQYANQFVSTFWTRLWDAQSAAGRNGSGELVLASRQGAVDEAFYGRYPHLRPAEATPDDKPSGRKPRKLRVTAKMLRDMERRNSPEAQRGRQAGKAAAETVDIRGTKSREKLEG